MAKFAVDDRVRVLPLGKDGEIVELLTGERVRVRIGAFTITCRLSEITPIVCEKKSKQSLHPRASSSGTGKELELSIDLHGLTGDEAVLRVEQLINREIQRNLTKLTIIHGKGSGKLKTVVTAFLEGLSVVRKVDLDPVNPGVTHVYF